MNAHQCRYPDRWSIEHERCEGFQSVDCGTRLPKYNPWEHTKNKDVLERGYISSIFAKLSQQRLHWPHGRIPKNVLYCELASGARLVGRRGDRGGRECILGLHHGNCTGQNNGLYYKQYNNSCGFYGCINDTVVELYGNVTAYYRTKDYTLKTFFKCPDGHGINRTTGICEAKADCPYDTVGYVPDSPYLWCTDGEVRSYVYDYNYRLYWRCQNGVWTVESCPEDVKMRQFHGQISALRLYKFRLSDSEIYKLYDPLASCKQWGSEAHPIDYATDFDPSTYWLSQAGLPSVDLTFDFTGMYTLEEISMTFFGPVALVVSIFKKVTTGDSWQLWRVFRDDCDNDLMCSQLGTVKLDGERLTYSLVEANLGPLQRRASSLRVRLSGHRHEGAAQLRDISYFGLYNFAISRRVSNRCGIFEYVEYESSRICQPCNCDVRGVIDGNVECNEVLLERGVWSGYDNIRESDPDGCSKATETSTSSTPLTSLTTLTSLVTSTSLGTPTSLVTPTSSKKSITLTLSLPTIIACSAVVVTVVVVIIVSVVCVRRRRRGPPQSQNTTTNPTSEHDSSSQQPIPSISSNDDTVYTELTTYEHPMRASTSPNDTVYTELAKPRAKARAKRSKRPAHKRK
ncbi:hypothetical protein LSAT2_031205 [Lamellibrachia satsuma]|nr:hypothetical protein LSAT2_031205 [Lamellibrachia satsuma]